MKRTLIQLALLALCSAHSLTALAVDDRDLYFEKAYPGSRCKFYGLQSADTFMATSYTKTSIVNSDNVTHYAVCPIVNDLAGHSEFDDAEIYVEGGATCWLYVRESDVSSTVAYSKHDESTDSATQTKKQRWCRNCFAGGELRDMNAGSTASFYCSVPPGGTINGYFFRVFDVDNL